MRCTFLAAEVPDPCPRLDPERGCLDCHEAIEERAAILEFGQAFSGCSDPALPPQSEHATCATREEADRLARQQAAEAMRRASAQRELFEPGET